MTIQPSTIQGSFLKAFEGISSYSKVWFGHRVSDLHSFIAYLRSPSFITTSTILGANCVCLYGAHKIAEAITKQIQAKFKLDANKNFWTRRIQDGAIGALLFVGNHQANKLLSIPFKQSTLAIITLAYVILGIAVREYPLFASYKGKDRTESSKQLKNVSTEQVINKNLLHTPQPLICSTVATPPINKAEKTSTPLPTRVTALETKMDFLEARATPTAPVSTPSAVTQPKVKPKIYEVKEEKEKAIPLNSEPTKVTPLIAVEAAPKTTVEIPLHSSVEIPPQTQVVNETEENPLAKSISTFI